MGYIIMVRFRAGLGLVLELLCGFVYLRSMQNYPAPNLCQISTDLEHSVKYSVCSSLALHHYYQETAFSLKKTQHDFLGDA